MAATPSSALNLGLPSSPGMSETPFDHGCSFCLAVELADDPRGNRGKPPATFAPRHDEADVVRIKERRSSAPDRGESGPPRVDVRGRGLRLARPRVRVPEAKPANVLVELPLREDAAVYPELMTPSDDRRTWARRPA